MGRPALAESESFFYQDLNQGVHYKAGFDENCHQVDFDDVNWPTLNLYTLSEYQHYCLRAIVDITEHDLPIHTVMKMYMLGSFEIYWDGELIGKNGIAGDSISMEKTGSIGITMSMSKDQLSIGKHLLSMNISTYHHIEDMQRIFYAAMLVDQTKAMKNAKYDYIAPLMLCGAMLLLFVFFQLMYWYYQKDPAFMTFSLLSVSSGILIALELLKYFYAYPWDWHVLRLKIIIFTVMITAMLLLLYYVYYYRFKSSFKWLILAALLMFSGVVFAPGYDFKSLSIFIIAMLGSLIINVIALKNNKDGATINTTLLIIGIVSMVILPERFIDQWFAALFSVIAIANLFSLTTRFGHDREKALMSLKLEAEMLRRNLQPHFLMNSLMLIIEWIETQPDLAVEFVESLAEEFSMLNNMSKLKQVTLREELALCQKHFNIMKARYQLNIHLEIDDIYLLDKDKNLDQLNIPPAVVHTVIENAFSHNRIKDDDQFKIIVNLEENNFVLKVITPYRATKHQGTGTGESYIKTRLAEHYGRSWQYESKQQDNHWQTTMVLSNKQKQTLERSLPL